MTIHAKSCHSLLLLLLLVLPCFTQVIIAGRPVPAPSDKKTLTPQALGQEGTARVPGLGRFTIGSIPRISGFGDLDHSGPAARNSRYLPGFDDTFVPNPGFEIPNPYRGSNP
ncbi:putative cell wall protein [Cocos nucifera]|uniref:Putative cell wall protein n=1 Tax=Cocos nucifera TaxID=13894 RepID=A0A8K0IUY5_COCNU|nr:putative cell wall protein [Cocos nucifera]